LQHGRLGNRGLGTALGVIRTAHEQGKRVHVLVDETRPRLQGARLTAWELEQYTSPRDHQRQHVGLFFKERPGSKSFLRRGPCHANGDVANKIGTYMLALAAHDNNVPAYSVVQPRRLIILAHGGLIRLKNAIRMGAWH